MFSKSNPARQGDGAPTPEHRQIKIAKRRRFWRKTGKALLWALVLAFVAHLSLNIYASVQLNREFAAIRAKGEPLRLSDMEPPAVPDTQNAALVYQQAIKSLHFSTDEKVALITRASILTPQQKVALESAIRNNQTALNLTRKAAAMPQCVFPFDWQGNWNDNRFPQYTNMRQLARLVATNARLKAQEGKNKEALDDVRTLFGLSHHLSNEPSLIGFLVAQAVDSIAYTTLGQVLETTPLTVAQARTLEGSFPRSDWKEAFRHSLLGDRTFSISVFERIGQPSSPLNGSGNEGAPLWLLPPVIWLSGPLRKLDEVQTLRIWRATLDSAEIQQVPVPASLSQKYDSTVWSTPFYAVVTKILSPVFSSAASIRDRAEVRHRLSIVALALTRFRTARGRYPSSLQEAAALWGQTLPLDPYSQKPFLYKSDGKTFALYSIGPNQVDDGGKGPLAKKDRKAPLADDIGWLPS